MNSSEIEEYLDLPLLADLATVRPDGSPHVAPVWFRFRDGQVQIVAEAGAVKTRNIHHEPRVSLSVATHDRPYRYVLISGSAELSREGIPELTRALAIRYQGEEEGNRYADKVLGEMDFCVINIRPDKIISWNGDD